MVLYLQSHRPTMGIVISQVGEVRARGMHDPAIDAHLARRSPFNEGLQNFLTCRHCCFSLMPQGQRLWG
jgi:hypothetical protein